jgi:hypothetical protein
MRKFLLITALLASSLCQAQDTLFRIISVKGLVTLDDDTLKSGIIVTSLNRALQVKDKFAYTTILTEKGFAFQLGRGKYTVKEISTDEHSNLSSIGHPGLPITDNFSPVRLVNIPNDKNFLFRDSLTVLARPYKNQVQQYRLTITNMFEENLYDSTSISHVHTVSIPKLAGEHLAFILRVTSESEPKLQSHSYYVKRIPSKDRAEFSYDLGYVKSIDFVNRQLAILALCEIHELYFDQLYHLYKLWKYSQNTGTKITSAYYQRLFKAYDLEKFLPIPLTGY